jgi:hypothetical protein
VIAAAARLPVIRLHEGRHSAATLALESGASMKEVQDLLGHSTYHLTANTYSHVRPAVRAESAERVARLVDGQPVEALREQIVSSSGGRSETARRATGPAEESPQVKRLRSGGRGIRTLGDIAASAVFKSPKSCRPLTRRASWRLLTR